MPNDASDAASVLKVGSFNAPDAAKPTTGAKPRKGQRPEPFVAARRKSAGVAAASSPAYGARPKRPPQTKASVAGFSAAQERFGSARRRVVLCFATPLRRLAPPLDNLSRIADFLT